MHRLIALALAAAFVQPSLASAAASVAPANAGEHVMPPADGASHDCGAPMEQQERSDNSRCDHEGAAACAAMPGCIMVAEVTATSPTQLMVVAIGTPSAPVDAPPAASRTPEPPPPRR